MPYATATELLGRFDAEEFAQRADRGVPRLVSAEMLKTAAANGSLAAYTPAEQAATLAALAIVNQALGDADNEINGRIGGRYPVPFVSTPKIIVRYACDLARFFLYDDQATEQIEKRYSDAISFLTAVGKGTLGLGVDASGGEVAAGDGAQMENVSERVFTREGSKDY